MSILRAVKGPSGHQTNVVQVENQKVKNTFFFSVFGWIDNVAAMPERLFFRSWLVFAEMLRFLFFLEIRRLFQNDFLMVFFNLKAFYKGFLKFFFLWDIKKNHACFWSIIFLSQQTLQPDCPRGSTEWSWVQRLFVNCCHWVLYNPTNFWLRSSRMCLFFLPSFTHQPGTVKMWLNASFRKCKGE